MSVAAVHSSVPEAAPRDESLPIVLRNTPSGYDWAFYSREDPRMHLQTTPDAETPCKVWLEKEGRWLVERDSNAPPPTKVLNAVLAAFEESPLLAWRVRAQWIRQMIQKGWLSLQVVGNRAVLRAYPGMHHEFTREVDLSKHAPPTWHTSPQDVKLDPETASIAVGVQRPEHEWILIDLAESLWL